MSQPVQPIEILAVASVLISILSIVGLVVIERRQRRFEQATLADLIELAKLGMEATEIDLMQQEQLDAHTRSLAAVGGIFAELVMATEPPEQVSAPKGRRKSKD